MDIMQNCTNCDNGMLQSDLVQSRFCQENEYLCFKLEKPGLRAVLSNENEGCTYWLEAENLNVGDEKI